MSCSSRGKYDITDFRRITRDVVSGIEPEAIAKEEIFQESSQIIYDNISDQIENSNKSDTDKNEKTKIVKEEIKGRIGEEVWSKSSKMIENEIFGKGVIH